MAHAHLAPGEGRRSAVPVVQKHGQNPNPSPAGVFQELFLCHLVRWVQLMENSNPSPKPTAEHRSGGARPTTPLSHTPSFTLVFPHLLSHTPPFYTYSASPALLQGGSVKKRFMLISHRVWGSPWYWSRVCTSSIITRTFCPWFLSSHCINLFYFANCRIFQLSSTGIGRGEFTKGPV